MKPRSPPASERFCKLGLTTCMALLRNLSLWAGWNALAEKPLLNDYSREIDICRQTDRQTRSGRGGWGRVLPVFGYRVHLARLQQEAHHLSVSWEHQRHELWDFRPTYASFTHAVLRADYGPTFTQRKGVTDPLRPCGPSLQTLLADPPCVHRKGPDVRLPEIVTFRQGDAATRAVIGPLTKTRCRTIKVHDCVDASAWSLRCVNVGRIISALYPAISQ